MPAYAATATPNAARGALPHAAAYTATRVAAFSSEEVEELTQAATARGLRR